MKKHHLLFFLGCFSYLGISLFCSYRLNKANYHLQSVKERQTILEKTQEEKERAWATKAAYHNQDKNKLEALPKLEKQVLDLTQLRFAQASNPF